ncbi:hypothetical protein CEXT_517221 [Caerostris extrusa]|uniref:Uncharacterized protein n=1 Tax=Caerostris extrusa TaxID=172846 RepID=A0AAV4N225_CAEEX|nr:hypothetical protein CEXT_517221 [Caerostris extrusa]
MSSSPFHRRLIDNHPLRIVCELVLPLAKREAQSLDLFKCGPLSEEDSWEEVVRSVKRVRMCVVEKLSEELPLQGMSSSPFHRRLIDNHSLRIVCELLLPLAKIEAKSLYEIGNCTHKKERMKEKKNPGLGNSK